MINRLNIFGILIVVLLLILVLGPPDEINIYGFKWGRENLGSDVKIMSDKENQAENKKYRAAADLLSIEELKSRQEIYALDENATIDFKIIDDLQIPYNITTSWFYNSSRYYGWRNESNITKSFYSWYPISERGEWEVQVVLEWNYKNLSYSKDSVTFFEVL